MRRVGRCQGLGAILFLVAGLLPAALSAVAQAPQAPPASQTPAFQDSVSVGLVLVPVVVRAGAGFAKNLDSKDFRLLVDGQRVTIESFERRSDAPASLVILQDLSGSMATGNHLE